MKKNAVASLIGLFSLSLLMSAILASNVTHAQDEKQSSILLAIFFF